MAVCVEIVRSAGWHQHLRRLSDEIDWSVARTHSQLRRGQTAYEIHRTCGNSCHSRQPKACEWPLCQKSEARDEPSLGNERVFECAARSQSQNSSKVINPLPLWSHARNSACTCARGTTMPHFTKTDRPVLNSAIDSCRASVEACRRSKATCHKRYSKRYRVTP